jgi:hypothetical protein
MRESCLYGSVRGDRGNPVPLYAITEQMGRRSSQAVDAYHDQRVALADPRKGRG